MTSKQLHILEDEISKITDSSTLAEKEVFLMLCGWSRFHLMSSLWIPPIEKYKVILNSLPLYGTYKSKPIVDIRHAYHYEIKYSVR